MQDIENHVISQNCSENDVISFEDESHKISQFYQKIIKVLTGYVSNNFVEFLGRQGVKESKIQKSDELEYSNGEWFNNGKECDILRMGANGWQKGKVRLRVIVEFCPDEPEVSESESPLDDLRQQLIEIEAEQN
ncbi:MAG: KGK domain-containing protein [Cyanobacteriota bacterium]|nr:KGK domain-containing protein [Cyanobacteriota bacterium]